MDARFEILGFSVARKHAYFYALLLLATLFANTVKEFVPGETDADRETARLEEVQNTVKRIAAGP
ncbi:MAG: hypothetical protein L0Y58_11425 [Verrucomicrobia subdivision 3 bacterium]|nr:hypothetical protein [Limisphaerales bacterium]